MIEEPLVSILMTAYNRERYIGEAIESVLASTYKNFELIIVDDNSSDDTAALAKKYYENDDRISFYKNINNLGQFPNRNKAASYAKGTFIKYLDSDDTIKPEGLQIMVEGMLLYPQAALGFCHTIGYAEKNYPFLISSEDAFKKHFLEGGLLFTGPSGLIMKRRYFETTKGFEDFGMPSDNHLSLKLAAKAPIVALKPDLFNWREHEAQVYNQNKENHFNILNNFKLVKNIISNHSPLSQKVNKKILYNSKKIFFLNLAKLFLEKRKPLTAFKIYIKSLRLSS